MAKKNKRRIGAALLAFVMACSPLFSATTAYAKGVSMSFEDCVDSNGNLIRWQHNVSHNGSVVEDAGNVRTHIYADGDSAYCIEPGHTLNTGDVLESASNDAWDALSDNQREAVNVALLYGAEGNKSALSGTADEKWVATQLIIWEIVTGCRKSTGEYTCTNDKFYYGMCDGANSVVASNYKKISAAMADHNTLPSFAVADKGDATAKGMKWDSDKQKYVLTLTDTNGVLSKFDFSSSSSDVKVSTSGNTMTVTADDEFSGTVTLSAKKSIPTVSSGATLVAYGSPSIQDVVVGVKNTTVNAYLKVKIPYGHMKLVKTSEDDIVSGIKFKVEGNGIEKTVTMGEDGSFNITLPAGTYTVTEQSIERYVPQTSKKVTVQADKTATVSFSNRLKKFRVTLIKTDKETGTTAQGDATLTGATYGIYKDGELVDRYTTGENASFTTKYYVCGTGWTVKEISPSKGYLLNDTVYPVGAEPKLYTVEYNTTDVAADEQPIKGSIAIIKHTDDGSTQIETPEKGATFEVYLKSAGSYDKAKKTERDILVCDANGFAQTKQMPYGTYTVHQTIGWEGCELMKDFDVFISKDGEVYRYIINNSEFGSYIKIVKKDAETGKTIPCAGVGFQIYDPDGRLVAMTYTYPKITTIDTFYTAEDGFLVTPEALDYGKGYSLVEVQAPEGYVLNSEPIYFDVVQEVSEEESGITLIEVVRSNMPQKGRIFVSKFGEVFQSVTENNGLYQPSYGIDSLPGATYEITAAEDIITPDGTVRAEKGAVVDVITTGAGGVASSKELYLGKYEVRETEAPYGMTRNDEVNDVELVYAGQEVEVTETATSFYNERQKVEISLEKILIKDKAYDIGDNGEILDVAFGLYAETELIAADGTAIPADGLIEVITPDENGQGKAVTDLPIGSYYVKEIATNDAYLFSDEKYPVNFEYAGQDTATVQLSANDGSPIYNDIIYGAVSGRKTDEDGKDLGGAFIGIFKPGTTEFTKETALTTTTSTEEGSFNFARVPYGNWIVHEIESPEGFVLSDEEIPVTISEVDEVVEIGLVNEFITGNIELTKVDKDYPDKHLSGAEFEVYADSNDNGELDRDDGLLGKMKELDDGVYQMADVRYGKYFIKETKAPEGYVLDEKAYPVSIEEDGKTYAVDNTDGKGFANARQTGDLKIVKTSSNGKVKGFSFRVTSEEGYDETFTTDGNGEISIEDLRIGEYTVSEVSNKASSGYILPDDKTVTVKADKTTTVKMHNQLSDRPKTGDDANWWWIAIAALGAGVAGFAAFKGRKKKKA